MSAADLEAHQRWITEIRDPAARAMRDGLGVTIVIRAGRESARYDLAPVPGGWTFRHESTQALGGHGTPWKRHLHPSREDAEAAALAELVTYLRPDRNCGETVTLHGAVLAAAGQPALI